MTGLHRSRTRPQAPTGRALADIAPDIRSFTLALLVLLLSALIWAGPASARNALLDEIECLALNIYFEARGEPDLGKRAVGHVVLNRVADERFPGSVCAVVRQGGEERKLRCQFTWWCDGRSDRPEDLAAWRSSMKLARSVFWGFSEDPTAGALWYHATYVKPVWRTRLTKSARIGDHLFYAGGPTPIRAAAN